MAEFGQALVRKNAPAIFDRLLAEFELVCNVQQNVDDVGEALCRLTASRDDLRDAIASSPQQPRPEQVQSWFDRVDQVEVKVAKIQQDYRQRCLCLASFSPNIISSYSISRRAVQRHERVKALLQEYDNVKNLPGQRVPASCVVKPLPNVVVGKSLHLAKVLARLDDDETGIISICGMAGVGKSELMRCVNNEFLPGAEKGKVFKFVVWVDNASSGVKVVQDEIARRLELQDLGPLNKEEDAERRADPIFKVLNNTSFLVLLDNLTSPAALASIGIPNPIHHRSEHKQKVVLTTPFKDVSGKMGSDFLIDVGCLGHDDSWELFTSFLSEAQIQENKVIAEQVMDGCGGLPAALTKIGGAMATRRQPDDWRRMVRLLKSSKFNQIPGMEEEHTAVLRDLRKSYDRLSDENHRHGESFLCCALWPRGRSINKTELIDCWIGHGLISDPSPDVAFLEGFSIISRLQDEYLLLSGDNGKDDEVKLQPIVRDMALWIACDLGKNNKWMVHDGVNLNAEDRVIELGERLVGAEKVSLMYSSLQEVQQPALSSPRCLSLAVLMLQHNNKFITISGAFLASAPALKYLDLSHTEIQELPEELGTLLMLQYLSLSFTKVKALPTGLGNLKQLKHLLLKHTNNLSLIPRGIFRSLPNLQVLDMYPSRYMCWEDKDINRGNGEEVITTTLLEDMSRSSEFIRSLGITINTFSMAQMLGRLVNVCTTRLLMTHFGSTPLVTLCPSGFKGLMGSFSLLETLLEITIAECNTLEQLVFDGEEEEEKRNESWCLMKLESLELRGLTNLRDIVWKRMSTAFFLQALLYVKIDKCDGIRNVSWIVGLNRLEHLEIRNCAAVSSVVHDPEPQDGEEQPPTFTRLTTLVLVNLPELCTICSPQDSLPSSLKDLQVVDCHKLRTTPIIKPQSEASLPEIQAGTSAMGTVAAH